MSAVGYSESEVAAIGQWLKDGLSSAKIAAMLTEARGQTVTRNAIVGVVHRNKDLKQIGFAHQAGGGLKTGGNVAERPVKAVAKPIVIKPKLRASTASAGERAAYDRDSRHLPLADLDWRDCRWPVNEAGVGEQHLFCGHTAAEGSSYCRHHAARNIQAG